MGFPAFISSFSNLIQLSTLLLYYHYYYYIPNATVTTETGSAIFFIKSRIGNRKPVTVFCWNNENVCNKCVQEDKQIKLKVEALSPSVTVNYSYRRHQDTHCTLPQSTSISVRNADKYFCIIFVHQYIQRTK
jgi:hypothetical protein